MNRMLDIKLRLNSEKNTNKVGSKNLKKNAKTSSKHIQKLLEDLKKVKSFYEKNNLFIKDVLIDVYYNDTICKTGRISELLKIKGDCNDSIVGARFSDSKEGEENHIITHYVPMNVIDNAINKLEIAKSFIENELNKEANSINFDSKLQLNYSNYNLSKTKLRDTIIDCSVLTNFGIPNVKIDSINDSMIVTFYQTELDIYTLLNKLEIDGRKYYYSSAGKNTLSVSKETLEKLVSEVPYLISMTAVDISKIEYGKIAVTSKENIFIPTPKNEPTIGVIDTLFDDNVYFSSWVEYHETLDEVEKLTKANADYVHGTSVTSLIVDGVTLNPSLDDGCGRFKVRHFGVSTGYITISKLVKKIEDIIIKNQDIHVWNLSLGTTDEVSKNFISFDAAAIDSLEQKYNIIFVISGTNDLRKEPKNPKTLRVGSPADSLNSVVVNSVRKDGTPATYSRKGKVLSFFNKPDVSCFGGDFDERINVYTPNGLDEQYGTSFAAPWISRKLCYLIDVLKFTREVAKALLIDAAAGWRFKQSQYKMENLIGFGVVPQNINDILNSEDDEIKFVLKGISNSYYTTNYAIPVPKNNGNKSFYIARATLCYFPECNRLQGVDYTQRELSLKFGIVNNESIQDINFNTQDDDDKHVSERKAREKFRKWENTKFISSLLTTNKARGKSLYNEGFWGISITSKERARVAKMDDLKFGVVVTLKNKKGENRLEEFKHSCLLQGYLVNEIDIKNKIEFYNDAQEEIKFD